MRRGGEGHWKLNYNSDTLSTNREDKWVPRPADSPPQWPESRIEYNKKMRLAATMAKVRTQSRDKEKTSNTSFTQPLAPNTPGNPNSSIQSVLDNFQKERGAELDQRLTTTSQRTT